MKHIFLVLLGLLLCAVVFADNLTEEQLFGTWELYWVEIFKADHYFLRAGGGDLIEFHENHQMIRKAHENDSTEMRYVYRLTPSSREILVYQLTEPPEFIFRWKYEYLNTDVFVASLWCPVCEGKQDSEDVTVFVRKR